MHICIREDAYRADRCEVARIFRSSTSENRQNEKRDPREVNKLWSEKFSERERERRGTMRGWYKEEYGVRRWRYANEFSMPFPYPISMIGVYWRERWRILAGLNYLFVARFFLS